jgi:hypothetical protein
MMGAGIDPAKLERQRSRVMRWLGELLFRDWGLKAIALLVAAFLFVFTRDEVTRVFTVPLKVVEDPERVLLTELPESVQVQARGPWTRINRLQDYDFGVATVDLRQAKPGPLEIDRGSIVMPSGVVLAGVQYDHVDLRFDPVIVREVEVEPRIEGAPAPDYELVRVEAVPSRVRVRGGESFVRRVQSLPTEPLDVTGADHHVQARLALEGLPASVALVSAPGQADDGMVTVTVVVAARQQARAFDVPLVLPEGIDDPTGAVPRRFEVTVTGPAPDFRVLDDLGVDAPVQAQASKGEGEGDGGGVVEVQLEWAEAVPQDLRERLTLDRSLVRVALPLPPPPPASLEVPTSP